MDALKRSMRWDEEAFGREYDLDVFNIVAVSDFNMGAMENKGLNIFNDKYVLADQETATDADFANIEAIIAHEYFHNWTGNRITCRDWFQLCLKEGLTVFRDHEFSADQRSRAVKRIAEVRTLRAHQFPEDQGPLAHPVRPRRYREINNFYTATVYEKGSEVVRMIRTILGPDAFRAGMDLYFERHDGEAATIEDFIKVFEDASGRDLSQFALWYHQAGTPNLTVSSTHNPAAREFTLEIEQSVPPTPSESRKRLMHIPLAFGLIGAGGRPVEYSSVEGASVEDGVIHVRKRRHMVRFSGVAERPAVSLNRGFSAPVTLSVEQKADDQFFLARHDSDAFSRWQAFNTLLTDALIAAFRQILGGKQPVFAQRLTELAGSIAGDETLEPAYRALALALPGDADIARDIGKNIDPDAIHAAREALTLAIGSANRDTFAGLYDRLADKAAFSPDAASAGRRALRNILLDYLSLQPGGAALAIRPLPIGDQHDRPRRRTYRARASPPRFARGNQGTGGFRDDLWIRPAGHGQMVPDPGQRARSAGRRHSARPDRSSGLLDGQSEPGALVDRHILQRQPDRLPPRRRRGLQVLLADGARGRKAQPASGGKAGDGAQIVAFARTWPAGQGQGSAAFDRRRRKPVGGFEGHCRAHAGVIALPFSPCGEGRGAKPAKVHYFSRFLIFFRRTTGQGESPLILY